MDDHCLWFVILTININQDRPVTKVLLYPKTGRRHQLRLHCAALGHPIVGDWTYNTFANTASTGKRKLSDEDVEAREIPGRDASRMMLHAFKLQIPVSKYYSPNSRTPPTIRESCEKLKLGGECDNIIDVCSEDPFVIVDDKLEIS
jgi:23S rRNA-/tRNA-specific pseudouridylate synthase